MPLNGPQGQRPARRTDESRSPAPPALPARLHGRVREVDRLEWRVGDVGDPAALLEDFLADAGLPARDLARAGLPAKARGGALCGAALLVSAAAGAAMAGVAAGAGAVREPVPEVPDVVAVLHAPADPADGPAGPEPGGERPGGERPGAERRGGPETGGGAGRAGGARGGGGWRLGEWRRSWTAGEHADAVDAVRAAIARGDVYQVTLVGHRSAALHGDPGGALRAVAALPGASYGGVLAGAGWAVASASPECFLTVRGGTVTTRPIKGTRPRDARGRAELLASAKERAEHVMIVDLERNDLARVARTGTVEVRDLYALRGWCDLWQAESTVAARLADGVGLAELLRATSPGGSVTGAPKRAALDVLTALEPVGRGPSMGAAGYLDPDGLDLGLTIRTVAVAGGRVHLWTGGGITWSSDPAAEVAEAEAKAAPLLAALAGT